jgi:hypothetical protein
MPAPARRLHAAPSTAAQMPAIARRAVAARANPAIFRRVSAPEGSDEGRPGSRSVDAQLLGFAPRESNPKSLRSCQDNGKPDQHRSLFLLLKTEDRGQPSPARSLWFGARLIKTSPAQRCSDLTDQDAPNTQGEPTCLC